MKQVRAKELQITDRIITFSSRGDRSYPIEKIQRVPGRRLSIEVWTRGAGTWNFHPDDLVVIKG